MEAQILWKLYIVKCASHALIDSSIWHEVHCGSPAIAPTKFDKPTDFFFRQVNVLSKECLIELGNLYCTFLEHIAGHEGPVDVFPLIAQLDDEILVEGGGSLVVNFVHTEWGLWLGLGERWGHTLLSKFTSHLIQWLHLLNSSLLCYSSWSQLRLLPVIPLNILMKWASWPGTRPYLINWVVKSYIRKRSL